MSFIFYAIILQIFFSMSDILARQNMKKKGTYWRLVCRPWLGVFVLFQVIAVSIYFYLLHNYFLNKVTVLLAALGLFLSVICGSLYLHERITLRHLMGVLLVLGAIILQGI